MTNLGPYRTSGKNLEVVLDEFEKEYLIKDVISKKAVDINGLSGILYNSGYVSDDSEIFLRYKKTTPIFPDKFRPLEDRFVAVVKKIGSDPLLVSGPYNNDIADLNRNLDAIRDIDSAYAGRISKIVKTADNRFFKYAYEGVVGTVLSVSLIAGSTLVQGGIILGSLLGIAAGAYYVKNRFKPISKETISAANYLSGNSKGYIFNDDALIKIETEAFQIRKDRKRHEVFAALGGKLSVEDFFKTIWDFKSGRTVLPGYNLQLICAAFEKTHSFSVDYHYADLIRAIDTLFDAVSWAE